MPQHEVFCDFSTALSALTPPTRLLFFSPLDNTENRAGSDSSHQAAVLLPIGRYRKPEVSRQSDSMSASTARHQQCQHSEPALTDSKARAVSPQRTIPQAVRSDEPCFHKVSAKEGMQHHTARSDQRFRSCLQDLLPPPAKSSVTCPSANWAAKQI